MRPRPLFAAALLLILPSCQWVGPEPTPDKPDRDKPQFDEEYYQENALRYFHGKQYARAQHQWNTVVTHFSPDDWLARLGIASCDYYLGSARLDRGDIAGAREQLNQAEKGLRAIWNGTVEADTADTSGTSENPERHWQAALILALTHRALGDADHMEVLRLSQQLLSLPPGSGDSAALARTHEERGRRKAANYSQALTLLDRLVAMRNFSPEALVNRAELRQRMGDTPGAERDFTLWLDVARASLESHQAARKTALETPGSEASRREILALWDEKIASVRTKQVSVLLRLGNMHFDRGTEHGNEALLARGIDEAAAIRARQAAREHFRKAVDVLDKAEQIAPERIDILVKLAQVQGELGNYELALGYVNRYIGAANRDPGTDWESDMSQAYMMKAEFERQLAAAGPRR